MKLQFLGLRWCIAVAFAAGILGLGLAVGLRERLWRPRDPVEFQRRIDAWKKLDQELTPEQRLTGPKRKRD
jgi:hypothetical protein